MTMVSANLGAYMYGHDSLDSIFDILEDGKTILYPTDTFWAMGCDATNEQAVEKLYKLKRRQPTKGFVVLVSSIDMLKDYVSHLHPRMQTLLEYHNRPLTMIIDGPKQLAPTVGSVENKVAIRLVRDEFCRQLIEAYGRPLVATAACIGDAPRPANFGSISSEVLSNVDYVVKVRQNDTVEKEPSVIVSVNEEGEMTFVRE